MVNAWASAYTFHAGPCWIPKIFISLDIAEGVEQTTNWWNTLSNEDVNNILVPFRSDDKILLFRSNDLSLTTPTQCMILSATSKSNLE